MDSLKTACFVVQEDYEIDTRVMRKAESLIARDYAVDVIALRAKSRPHASQYELNGVTVYAVPLEKRRGSFVRYVYEYLAFFFMAFFKVSMLMLCRRYQLVDVNNLPDFLVFAALLPKILGAKIVLDMHEVMPEFYMSKYGAHENNLMIRLIRWQEKLSTHFADHVITINHPIQQLLESRGLRAQKVTIIMNSADDSLFDAAKVPRRRPRTDGFVMMHHGTLAHIYGVDIAIKAFGKVEAEMPDAQFWILGNGPEKARLEHLAKELKLDEKVKFLGVVSPQEIPRWLSCCDVGVLPTRKDIFLDLSFPNKLPEFIISGKPVVITKLKAISHYFSPDALMFFAPEDHEDLARQFVRLYRDPKLRESLAREARKEYEKINWAVMRRRYLDILTRSQSNE